MAWYLALALLSGTAITLMMAGVPVAFAFIITNIIGAFIFMGGTVGVIQFIANGTEGVTNFSLIPIPLFLAMGTLFFRSGLAARVLDALDRSFGSVPARLSYVTVSTSAVFASLSGSSIANTGMMGTVMVPEMLRRGYKPHMAMGPVLGSGGLAVIIPPSSLAVFLGSLARIDVGALLIAGILPGLLIAVLYIGLIYVQVRIDPEAAPSYPVDPTPLKVKLTLLAREVLPMGFIVFMVVGTIILGIATPTESAAFGCASVVILALVYRVLSWRALAQALEDAFRVTAMIFLLIFASTTFSQLLAFTGATGGLVNWATSFDLSATAMLLAMFAVLLVLGMFLDVLSMMLLTLPVFLPLAESFGFDLIWFAVIMLIALEISFTTPPFGMLLFVMVSVGPPGTTVGQVAMAALPYIACTILVVILLVLFPGIALFLPGLIG